MYHTKRTLAFALALIALFMTTVSFAGSEDRNPLTGEVGVNADDDSPESIKERSGSGNPVAGKEKSQLCQGCHGEDGNSADTQIPKLAGQYGMYIAKQLRNYQSGARKHEIMTAMAATISDEDLADIAAYFASQKKMKGAGSNNELGQKIFLNGDITRMLVACINCHGVNGKGLTPSTSTFPVIGGQHKDYLRAQLVNFKKNKRTNSANSIMNRITKTLTDEEMEALVEFISGQ